MSVLTAPVRQRGFTQQYMTQELPLIKVVGVSASGKSTLVQALRAAGYNARSVSQEHSHMATLWKQFNVPRVLIYLDSTILAQMQRRPDVSWDSATLLVEREKLQDAYCEADLRINSAGLSNVAVLWVTLAFLRSRRLRHAAGPLPPATATGAPAGPRTRL